MVDASGIEADVAIAQDGEAIFLRSMTTDEDLAVATSLGVAEA